MEPTSSSTSWSPNEVVLASSERTLRVGDTGAISAIRNLRHDSRSRHRPMVTISFLKAMQLLVGYMFVLMLVLKICQHLHRSAADRKVSRRRLSDLRGDPNGEQAEDSFKTSKQCMALERALFGRASAAGKRHRDMRDDEDEGTSRKESRVVPPGAQGREAAFGLLHSPEAPSTFQQQRPPPLPSFQWDNSMLHNVDVALAGEVGTTQGLVSLPYGQWDDAEVLASVEDVLARMGAAAPNGSEEPLLQQQSASSALFKLSGGDAPSLSSAVSFQAWGSSQADQKADQVHPGSLSVHLESGSETSPISGPSSGVLAVLFSPAHTPGPAGAQVQYASSDMHYRQHPFYRTPTIDQSACKEVFNLEYYNSTEMSAKLVVPNLNIIRQLLLQPALDNDSVKSLLLATARLVNAASHSMSTRPSGMRIRESMKALGLRFLAFDAVLAVHQIVGERLLLEKWWGDLTHKVNTEFSGYVHPNLKERARRHVALGVQISKLLNRMYKQQKRPQPYVVVTLKDMLLCSIDAPEYFKDTRFDGWREDDKAYRASLNWSTGTR